MKLCPLGNLANTLLFGCGKEQTVFLTTVLLATGSGPHKDCKTQLAIGLMQIPTPTALSPEEGMMLSNRCRDN